ncbi:putative enzyme related to lactoylglutathione lyase [Chryseobacterium sp. SLBN-27]|uniref:VOC family protein n=1 Tax=Chryseobacterium TaxID=59732 RepID=UPI0025883F75|nr:VOC family protein [Chryseobacterium sp. SLBN-27]MDR6157081.1 putative enzyme related to lactoylglutathione lyase [Chryseobacterium sp. SLBN-27]
MHLLSVRIITWDIERLINFYEDITGLSCVRYTPEFAEFKTDYATLAIGSIHTMKAFSDKEIVTAIKNTSVIIEFMVDDVDQLYGKIESAVRSSVIQKPTVMPWGNKSLLIRDPDGNLVNLFTPVSEQALRKFNLQH